MSTKKWSDVRAHSLAEVRGRKGLPQRQVADAIGVSTGRISQIEHGDLFPERCL